MSGRAPSTSLWSESEETELCYVEIEAAFDKVGKGIPNHLPVYPE